MPHDPTGLHHRRSVRLPTYDYAGAGLYFVTICIHDRAALFGAVMDEEMRLSALGQIADEEWRRTPSVRAEVVLDAHIVMPNHVHLLFGIVAEDGAGPTPAGAFPVGATRCVALPGAAGTPSGRRNGPLPGSVGAIVGQYKSVVSRRINAARGTPGVPVWQRGYHERVVRDEREAYLVRRYVAENPLRWHLDRYHVGG